MKSWEERKKAFTEKRKAWIAEHPIDRDLWPIDQFLFQDVYQDAHDGGDTVAFLKIVGINTIGDLRQLSRRQVDLLEHHKDAISDLPYDIRRLRSLWGVSFPRASQRDDDTRMPGKITDYKVELLSAGVRGGVINVEGIDTIGDLIQWTADDLLAEGATGHDMRFVRGRLARHGLALKGEEPQSLLGQLIARRERLEAQLAEVNQQIDEEKARI